MPFRIGTNRIKSNRVGSNTIGSAFLGETRVYGAGITTPSSADSNVQAFFNAVYNAGGTLTFTEQQAVSDLVTDIKNGGFWSSFIALYPFVGGTAASHKVNLANPGTYDLSFNGSWTHNTSGSIGDGSTTYANSGFNTNLLTTSQGVDFGVYWTAQTTQAGYDWGSFDGTDTFQLSSDTSGAMGGNVVGTSTFSNINLDRVGLSWVSSEAPNSAPPVDMTIHSRESFSITTRTRATTTTDFYLGARNNQGTADNFTDRTYATAFIASGLSGIIGETINPPFDDFNDTLGRKPY